MSKLIQIDLAENGKRAFIVVRRQNYLAEELIQPFRKRYIDNGIENDNPAKRAFRIGRECPLECIERACAFGDAAGICMLDDSRNGPASVGM